MYEILKKLLAAVEGIGDIYCVLFSEADEIWGDDIRIKGKLPDGREFDLELTVKKAADNESP